MQIFFSHTGLRGDHPFTHLGSSDDGNLSDFYDPRQSPPKAIVDSSPLQPAMDKNKECEYFLIFYIVDEYEYGSHPVHPHKR